jgi:DNA ligase (NAD+)
LVKAIKSKKNPPLDRFIYALGIRHVGSQTAEDLAHHFKTIEKLSKATIDELSRVEGIGEVVAESIVEWFERPSNQKLLKKFEELGVKPEPVKEVEGPLKGQNFVVTGSLESMSRDQAAEEIRKRGGSFQTAVTQETDYLVIGEGVGENKLAKARKVGTKQLDEKQFLRVLDKT